MVIGSNHVTVKSYGYHQMSAALSLKRCGTLLLLTMQRVVMERACVAQLETQRAYSGLPGCARTGKLAIPPSAATDFTT